MLTIAQIKNIPNLDLIGWIVVGAGAFLALWFLIAFFRFIGSSSKARKTKKKIKRLEEERAYEVNKISNAASKMNSGIPNGNAAPFFQNPYTPGMYEDINSPYNVYNKGKR